MKPMTVSLCPECDACPEVVIEADSVRIGEADNIVRLSHAEPGTSEEVAALVVFLASDAASHVSGTEVWIDGAQSLLV